jgi:AraC family transcriptional regulator
MGSGACRDPSHTFRTEAKITETDAKSTASGVARGNRPDRLWPDLSLTRVGGSRGFDNHCPAIHGHDLIVYTLSGTGRLFQRLGKAIVRRLRAGKRHDPAAGSIQRVYGAVPERLRVGVSERLVVEAMAEIGGASTVDLVPVLGVNDPLIQRGVSILYDELLKPQHPAQRLLVEGIATMLAAHLVRNYDARSRSPDNLARRLDPAALRSVIGFMDDHIDQHIALDELSNVARVSRFQFIRLFRVSTGLTPMRYLESRRIEFARELIRKNDMPMAEIVLAVGFFDQSHFVKRFRRHAGCTPGQYAAQIGGWTGSRRRI